MGAVGLAVAWAGYTLAYFGFCSLRGPGVGLLDLVIPGRAVTIPTGGEITPGVAAGALGGAAAGAAGAFAPPPVPAPTPNGP